MAELVTFSAAQGVATLTLNNGPVNTLSFEMRQAFMHQFQKALDDATIKAIVIASSVRLFSAGADISEFDSQNSLADPSLAKLCDVVDASPKVVVAAINGMALGGGLELALAADYRIAFPKARFALPEVTLGIIPGAGGTQRLPRLIAVKDALDMITGGAQISAQQALDIGLVSKLIEDVENVFEAAENYARELLDTNANIFNCKDLSVSIEQGSEQFFSNYSDSLKKKKPGFSAPLVALEAVAAACELPLDQGLVRENELFLKCMADPQARALQHVFFAERSALKVPGVDKTTARLEINEVAVIGAGLMGCGIAMNFLNAGIATTILDTNDEAVRRGLDTISDNYQRSVARGRITQQQADRCVGLLASSVDYNNIKNADLVIEAVFERMDVKRVVFSNLDRVCKPSAILASNTSILDIDELASITRRPKNVIGLHFFSPANVMRLLEIVRGEKTSPAVLAACQDFAKKIKKLPVVSGVCYGFIGNRMVAPYSREAFRMVLEGAGPASVDKALTDFGMAMGPLSMADMAGIDVGCMAAEANKQQWQHDKSYQALQFALRDDGHLGQKTGAGVYRYEGRVKHDHDVCSEHAGNLAVKLGIAVRDVVPEEIVERCIFMLINEGAKILSEGIAYRSSDIDLVYLNGYGFPAWRGGPMHYADELGLSHVVDRLKYFQETLGDYGELWFKPARLLEGLAVTGQKLSDYKGRYNG